MSWPLYTPHHAQLRRALVEPQVVRFMSRTDDVYLLPLLRERLALDDTEPFRELWVVAPGGQSEFYGKDLFRPKPSLDVLGALDDLAARLRNADRNEGGAVLLWLKDQGELASSPEVIARLKVLDRLLRERTATVTHRVLISGDWDSCPRPLAGIATSLELERPRDGGDKGPLKEFVAELLAALHARQVTSNLPQDDETLSSASRLLRGLDAPSLASVMRNAVHEYVRHGEVSQEGARKRLLDAISRWRDALLERSSVVEVVRTDVSKEQLGGLGRLKAWLGDAAEILEDVEDARNDGVSPPRAMLLAGVPGCGKSLAAKVTAAQLNRTLLRLDAGRLMGKYLGESEANLDEALKTAEASAPCVLLIDEMEKALASSSSGEGGGTTTRMLGRLLTWMQEHQHDIFVVATVNAVDHLPPELLRRGRFDEFFLVDLPNEKERLDILRVHLTKRAWTAKDEDLAELVKATERCSGADLEGLVKSAIQEAWHADASRSDPLEYKHFQTILNTFVPYGKQYAKDVDSIRERLVSRGFVQASLGPKEAEPKARERRGVKQLPAVLQSIMRETRVQRLRIGVGVGGHVLVINEDHRTAALEFERDGQSIRLPWVVKIDKAEKSIVVADAQESALGAKPTVIAFERVVLLGEGEAVNGRVHFRDPTRGPVLVKSVPVAVAAEVANSPASSTLDAVVGAKKASRRPREWARLHNKPARRVLVFESKAGVVWRVWLSADDPGRARIDVGIQRFWAYVAIADGAWSATTDTPLYGLSWSHAAVSVQYPMTSSSSERVSWSAKYEAFDYDPNSPV